MNVGVCRRWVYTKGCLAGREDEAASEEDVG